MFRTLHWERNEICEDEIISVETAHVKIEMNEVEISIEIAHVRVEICEDRNEMNE